MRFPFADPSDITLQPARQPAVIVLGQLLDQHNRVRPKIPIGPRGELAYLIPTYIGFERSHHAIPNQVRH